MNIVFNEIDRINANYHANHEKATEVEQECRTASFDVRINDEVKSLMNSPESLMDADIEEISKIVKHAQGNIVKIGIDISKYYRELAEEQARESI